MKNFTKIASLSALFCLLFFIQAQDFRTSDNDPNIDQPVYNPAFNIQPPHIQPMVVTGTDGYDNFNIGVNFAEVYQTTSPISPSNIFNAYNTNGGHWTSDGFTFNNVTPPAPNTAGDPWSGADSLGNLYYITLNSSVTGSFVMKSTNFGQTWGSAVAGCTGNDRETMAVDATGGPFAGYIYCGETPGNFSRSTDHGASFQQTATMTNNLPGFMMTPAPGPTGISGGAVYVVTSTGAFQSPTFTFYRSTDGGANFSLVSSQNGWVNVVGSIVGGRNSYNNMRLRPYPFIYADNSFGTHRGRVYVFNSANNPGGDGNKPSIYIRYSDDGCATFSAPVQINDDANPTTNAHFQEQGWCDKSTGKLYCQWMDTRNTPTADSAEIYASLSTDGGVTWAANQLISTAKMRINCPTCGGGGTPAYQGDYSGCSSNGNIADLAWTDFRAGSFGSYFAYFPDYALKVSTPVVNLASLSDSAFVIVSVPSAKLYTSSVRFTATVNPPPTTGTISMVYLNRTTNVPLDSLSAVPDSIKLRITTSGLVTPGTYTVSAISNGPNGTPVHRRDITLNISPIGIRPISTQVPNTFYLYQNYPNPFNPTTNIRIDLAKSGLVKLTVYDITGRKVEELLNSNYNAGKYSFNFDASNYATGVYFYKLETPQYTNIKKMVLVK